MAHYAELDGVNGLAICNDALSLPPDFELHYEIFVLSNGTEDYIAAPFNGRGIGFWSSFVAIYASTQQVYFSYPASGRPAIGDRVSLRLTSTDNGNGTFTIRCYMSVNAEAEVQLNKAVGNDIFSQPLSPRPMEWGRRPNTIFRKVGVIRTRYYESGVIQNDWDFNQSSGNVAPDLVGGNDATLSGGFSWIYYDNGGSEPTLHEFVGAVSVTASASAQLAKQVTLTSDLQVNAVTQSAFSKVVALSGESNVNATTVSLFEKSVTFTGTVQVNAASQSSVSKQVTLNGEASVIATSTGTLFNENVEIYTFAGGATIAAGVSGQIVKVGLFTGEVQVTTTAKGNAQKIAHLSGNAQVTSSTQSTFSKFAALTGNALAQVKTAAATAKRVLLAGAASVIAKASGTFFNTDTNVEAYELTVEGRVKAPLVVQGTIKSITIQGRVK